LEENLLNSPQTNPGAQKKRGVFHNLKLDPLIIATFKEVTQTLCAKLPPRKGSTRPSDPLNFLGGIGKSPKTFFQKASFQAWVPEWPSQRPNPNWGENQSIPAKFYTQPS